MSELRAACFGIDPDRDGWPSVSVVVPIRNEAAHIEQAVTSILAQDYPGELDICLAVAPSTDGTEAVAERLADADPHVSIVANPAGLTPAGLNAAIAWTSGAVVVRVDGHAELSDGYVRRAVETMAGTGAVNVGGMQVPTAESPFEESVAAATTSWIGAGGAIYRVGGVEGPVDTVYLGVFDRAAGDAVGWFDETLVRNQDYELNIRLRQSGGTVWFDPGLRVGYRPRGSFRALAKQYYEYGFWKAEVLRRYPGTLRLRQLVPAALPLVVVAPLFARRRRSMLAVPAAYCALVLAASARGPGRPAGGLGRVAAVVVTMHASWSAGFNVALSRTVLRCRRSTRPH